MKIFYIKKMHLIQVVLAAILVIVFLKSVLSAQLAVEKVSGQYREDIPIYSVDSEGKKCSVTFDCAWGADDIPTILDILDKYDAKATFFIVGLWAEKYPDKVKMIADRGHDIGNHGYSHAHMTQIPEAKVEEEIIRCNKVLEEISGTKVTLFRAPYGDYNATTVKTAKKLQVYTIQWDVDSLDWKDSLSADDIYKRVTKRVSSGSIILFHNDTRYTEKVLPSILDNLTSNGYSCIPVSELLLKGEHKIRFDGRQMR